MAPDVLDKVSIVELVKDEPNLPRLNYSYLTDNAYALSMSSVREAWKIDLTLKPLDQPLKKSYTGILFEEYVNEPRAFAAVLTGQQVGWIELGYEKWNNRMRVWQFLVEMEFRRMGIGRLLMDHGVKLAKEKGARMLVLETQSCNVPAIAFYLKQGFELIGFDAAAYSNEDISKREVRLEMGLRL